MHGREDGPPPPVDLAAERRTGEFVRDAIAKGAVSACHDVSDGGLAVALAEMALAGGIGAMINEAQPFGVAGSFFGEDQGLYLVTVPDDRLAEFLADAARSRHSRRPDRPHDQGPADLRTRRRRLVRRAWRICDAAHEGFFPALMGDTIA